MLLLLAISVENRTRYDDIVWQFVLDLADQPTKTEHGVKNNKLWK